MKVLGIDIGGTNIRAGLVEDGFIHRVETGKVKKEGSEIEIIHDLNALIGKFKSEKINVISIGVPSLVDPEKGIVYDATNILSWEKVYLKEQIEAENNVPVCVNNDANCFVMGEKHYGKVKDFKNIVGIVIGTGLGSGLILNNHLYTGTNCGAGEFGMIPYKDHNFEYYCSGQFFINEYGLSGEEVFRLAEASDERGLDILTQFGSHLGEIIKIILFSIDPEVVVLGGSVGKSYKYFKNSMWNSVNGFPYNHSLKKLKIIASDLDYCGILGAAAIYRESFQS